MLILQSNMGKKQENTQFRQNPKFFISGYKIKIKIKLIWFVGFATLLLFCTGILIDHQLVFNL